MPEKSMLPTMKSILLNFDENGDIYEACQGGTRYLRSTPLLERAEEMRDVLKEVIVGVNIDESCTCFVCKAGRLLAAIEKAEEALDKINSND